MLDHPLLICPRCRRIDSDRLLTAVLEQAPGQPAILGELEPINVLTCANPHCNSRFPVIQGIPVIFRDPRALALEISPPFDLLALPPDTILSLIEGALPADQLYSQVTRLARYIWAGFYDKGPTDPAWTAPIDQSPHAVQVVQWLKSQLEGQLPGRTLVAGAALGREGWAWGDDTQTVLLEAHLPSLLSSAKLEKHGALDVFFPDGGQTWRHFNVAIPAPSRPLARVCGDILDPPFLAESFQTVILPNLIDSVSDPYIALGQANAVTSASGQLVVSTPFAWRPEVTPSDRWLERLPGTSSHSEMALQQVFSLALDPPRQQTHSAECQWALRNSTREVLVYRNALSLFRRMGGVGNAG